MKALRLLVPTLPLAACSSTTTHYDPPVVTEVVAVDRANFDGWRTERIALPPGFAPTMPAGDELLLFAPGMFDPAAEDFWSYVFVMQVDQAGLDAIALDELFELYYDGLIQAVAGPKVGDLGVDPAQVEVIHTSGGHYEATVHLIEAFATMEPLELRVLIDVEPAEPIGSFLRVQASPQEASHPIWRSLEFAAANLQLEE